VFTVAYSPVFEVHEVTERVKFHGNVFGHWTLACVLKKGKIENVCESR
jgi:hypothetical protein